MNNQQLNKDYCANANLISTTDRSSLITHANQDFCDIAGYSTDELVGNPHNMVRHGDMPKQAFEQMWTYLKQGKSWMGLVKNQCKDEAHYWVSAFVTPIKNPEGDIVEYQSVRSKPDSGQVERAEALYHRLQQNKPTTKPRLPLHKLTLGSSTLLALLSLLMLGTTPSVLSAAITLVAAMMTFGLAYQYRRNKSMAALAQQAYSNPLMEKPYTNHFDDYSQVELALKMKQAELRAVTARATETSGEILISAEDEFGTIQSIGQSLDQQCHETEQVAAAVEQLTHSINEVASGASAASMLAEEADQESEKGLSSIHSTIAEVTALEAELAQAQTIINRLSQDLSLIHI